jgi:hypothetical protein
MPKDGNAARKKAFEFMTLAAKAPSDECRDIFRAMARSWVTLASQMDRLEAISVSVRSDARSERERRRATYIRKLLN